MNGMPEELIVGGIALAPLVSIIISILKRWVKLDPKIIPVINVFLGAVAVGIYAIVEQGLGFVPALGMVLGVVFGSQVFHETFGHAGKTLKEVFQKP